VGGDEGERDGRRSFEWRELLKSARPLKFSPAVNYPKKEITGGFEAPHPAPPALAVGIDRRALASLGYKKKKKKKKKRTLSATVSARPRF